MKIPRVLRGVFGTAVTWGAVWSLLSIPTLKALLSMPDSGVPVSPTTAQLIWIWATGAWVMAFTYGAVIGAGFALILHFVSRRVKFFQRLTFMGVGIAGALAPVAILFTVFGPSVSGSLLAAGLGATTAVLSLAVAHRTPDKSLSAPETATQLPAP